MVSDVGELNLASSFSMATQAFLLLFIVRLELSLLDSAKLLLLVKYEVSFKTKDGKKGEVHSINVLRQKVKLIVTLEDDTKEIEEYNVDDLRFKPRKRRNDNQVNDAELKALEALEAKEGGSKLND